MLEGYGKRHPEELDCVERIRALVNGHANCFDRSCVPGHITASSWIVSHDGARVLLTHHRKLGHWLQLGGHADGDPDACEVALREAREESGMEQFRVLGGGAPFDVDVHDIPARPGEPRHEHHDIRFLLVAGPDQPLVISAESNDLRWFAPAELAPHLEDDSIGRMARKVPLLLAAPELA
ncbi:MAG: NUDIX hydrolase [bacterium]|nr:NUDIX hydrolase [bacterium]